MGKHIMVEIPEGMEIDRIIFKPIKSIGIVDREIVVNKYGIRISLEKIAKFNKGVNRLLWDKLIDDLVHTEDGIARVRIAEWVRKNLPNLEDTAFEKTVSRVWAESRNYANEIIKNEYGLEDFIQAHGKVLKINQKYVR